MNIFELPVGNISNLITAGAALIAAGASLFWAWRSYYQSRLVERNQERQHYILNSVMRRSSPDDLERLLPYLVQPSSAGSIYSDRLEEILSRLESTISFQRRTIDSVAHQAALSASEAATSRLKDAISEDLKQFRNALLHSPESPITLDGLTARSEGANRPVAREISHALFTPLSRVEAICRTVESRDSHLLSGDELAGIKAAVQICFTYLNAFRATAFDPASGFPNIALAINAASTLYASQLGKSVNFEISAPDDKVTADSYYMLACALPLIENAVDAVSNGDTVTISVEESSRETTLLVGNPIKSRVLVSRIFEDGYSTKADGKSGHEGLGLGIAKSLARARGGDVMAKATKTRIDFTIKIPAQIK